MGLKGPTDKTTPKIIFRPGVPPPPDWLDEGAAVEYLRVIEELKAAGEAAQQVDMAIVAAYAQAYSDVVRLTIQLRTEGETIQCGKDASLKTHPLVRVRNDAVRTMRDCAARLGFSPVDRGRVPRAQATGTPDNPVTAFLSGR